MNRRLAKLTRVTHKWMGLVLGLQVLFWIAGGVVMSSIPLEKVHGKHLASKVLKNPFISSDYRYKLDSILARISSRVQRIEFTFRLDSPTYLIRTQAGVRLFNAINGEEMGALSQDHIEQLAQRHYLQQANIRHTEKISDIPLEASRISGEQWRVEFDDTWSTTLYFSPLTGELHTVRSDLWRLFDFMWMLHIMDYDERDDFNNPLLITSSISALLFTLTGIMLLFQSRWFKKRR